MRKYEKSRRARTLRAKDIDAAPKRITDHIVKYHGMPDRKALDVAIQRAVIALERGGRVYLEADGTVVIDRKARSYNLLKKLLS